MLFHSDVDVPAGEVSVSHKVWSNTGQTGVGSVRGVSEESPSRRVVRGTRGMGSGTLTGNYGYKWVTEWDSGFVRDTSLGQDPDNGRTDPSDRSEGRVATPGEFRDLGREKSAFTTPFNCSTVYVIRRSRRIASWCLTRRICCLYR